MKSKVVAILETRAGAHLADLVARRGGVPLLAPALEEVPDIDPQAVQALLAQWRVQPFGICIFQTGVGTRALFAATDAANLSAELQERLIAGQVEYWAKLGQAIDLLLNGRSLGDGRLSTQSAIADA